MDRNSIKDLELFREGVKYGLELANATLENKRSHTMQELEQLTLQAWLDYLGNQVEGGLYS